MKLNCLEEPKVVANELFDPDKFYMQLHDKLARVNHPMKAYLISPKSSVEQITSNYSLYPNSPTLTLTLPQGYSPKRPHLRRKSSPILTETHANSPNPSNSRRHSVDALEKKGLQQDTQTSKASKHGKYTRKCLNHTP